MSKITSLAPYLQMELWAEELEQALEGFDFEETAKATNATFACCVLTQRVLSVFCECMLASEEFAQLAEVVEKMYEEYMPSGPPMSPLTTSYFSYWLLYDARYNISTSTVAETFLACAPEVGVGQLEQESIAAFSSSRMGIYEHIGFDNDRICLKELVTNKVSMAISPVGYCGKEGEIWLVRVFPRLFPEDAHVIATTPYLLEGHKKNEWIEFFKRNKITEGSLDAAEKIQGFMKYGPSTSYWHEFIFQAYVSSSSNFILLRGIPDLKGTKPHES